MEQSLDEAPRTYVITRSQHLGYGFTAGEEGPTMVKKVEMNGPSYDRLQPGDIIMEVNGIDVEHKSRRDIINMIQASGDQIEITVRKMSYVELLRAKNLRDPKFYQLNKSHSNNNTISPPSSANQYVSQQQAPQQQPQRCQQPANSLSTNNQWQFNRLVTSIAQQHNNILNLTPSPNSTSNNTDRDTPPVQITTSTAAVTPAGQTNKVLKPKSINQPSINLRAPIETNNNGTSTIKGKNFIDTSAVAATKKSTYGRFSPIPQRCKSSMDGVQKNKKSNDEDLPVLKRRNTMKPIRPPPEVREILKVVIKIFFEGGHSRTLKYNHDTTVGVILETLNERLGKSPELEQVKAYFGLVLTNGVDSSRWSKVPTEKLLVTLHNNDSIMGIGQLPYSSGLRLLYRMAYPPTDVYGLYKQSKLAFEYLYQQSCNDLKLERFSPDLDSDTALKLAALHLLEYVHSNHSKAHGNSKDPKVYMKLIKKTRGIEYFLPASMAQSVLDQDGKRIVSQYKKLKAKLIKQLKKNFEEFNFEPPKVKSTRDINRFSTTSFHELILPEIQSSASDYIKLLFLNYLSQLPCHCKPERPAWRYKSPVEQISSSDCSSSIESVPRTADSLPLIQPDQSHINHKNNANSNSIATLNSSGSSNKNNINPDIISAKSQPNNVTTTSIARLTQMNSLRSMSSVRSPSQSRSTDQPDMAPTPSIESISSITFNLRNSPSPLAAAPAYLVPPSETYNNNNNNNQTMVCGLGPSPMPRHQTLSSRRSDFSSIDKLYNQRYPSRDKYIDDLLRNIIILPPPPPPSSLMFDDLSYQLASSKAAIHHPQASSRQLTQVLTDKDIEMLSVPPPPPSWS